MLRTLVFHPRTFRQTRGSSFQEVADHPPVVLMAIIVFIFRVIFNFAPVWVFPQHKLVGDQVVVNWEGRQDKNVLHILLCQGYSREVSEDSGCA